MDINNIENFIGGWLVGNFSPALFQSSDIEIGIKHFPQETVIERHYQIESTEYNYIASGELIANGHHLKQGDIFVYAPGEITEVKLLTDVTVVVFKTPSLGYDDKVVCDD